MYYGICAGPDGRLYCDPLCSSSVLVIEPEAQSLSFIESAGEAGWKHVGICAGSDGRLDGGPCDSSSVLEGAGEDGMKHVGFNGEYIKMLVDQNNGRNLETIFVDFLKQLKAKPLEVLKDDKDGLAIVLWCHWGKHRSVAMSAILVWLCARIEKWTLFEPLCTLLSKEMWSPISCGRNRSCPNCSVDLMNRDGEGWNEIIRIWKNAKRIVLGGC